MTKEFHYVYQIINLEPVDCRKFYIGVRSSNVHPHEDVKYMGSSKHLRKHITEESVKKFRKEILGIFPTREIAENTERELLLSIDAKNNPEYYNRHNATEIGFSQKGRVLVTDTLLGIVCSITKEEFENNDRFISYMVDTVPAKLKNDVNSTFRRIPLHEYNNNRENYTHSTENKVFVIDVITREKIAVTKEEFSRNKDKYVHTSKGQVTVFDSRDGTIKNVVKDEFDACEFYQSINKNKVNVVDRKTGLSMQVSKEEYYSNDSFRSVQENLVAVIDTRDGISKKVTKEEYHNNDYYIHHTNKTIDIFNENGILVYTSKGNFEDFCEKHNLSYQILCNSYKKGGEPIFQNISKISYDRLKRKNREFQIGWYAKIN